jgi:hypothetical protein
VKTPMRGRWIASGRRWPRWSPTPGREGYEGRIWPRSGVPDTFDYDYGTYTGIFQILSRPSPGRVRIRWTESFASDKWSGTATLEWSMRGTDIVFYGRWSGQDVGGKQKDRGDWAGHIPI